MGRPAGAGPIHVDGSRRPAAHEEVGQIDDVVAVQVGEEDRLDLRPRPVEVGVQPEAGAPHLSMGSLAAVDDVGGVPDDDRVGVAAARRLRVAAARGAEQHRSLGRVRDVGRAALPRGVSPKMPSEWLVRFAHSVERVGCVAHSRVTLLRRLVSSARPRTPLGGSSDDDRGCVSWARRDRGILEPRQDARPAADHAAVVRPDHRDVGRRVHQGAGRVRLPDHGDAEGDQPLLLRRLPSGRRRGA